MDDLAGQAQLADELARWAIAYVRDLPAGRQAFDTKTGPADLVTATDRAIERHVRDRIGVAFSRHRVVGEELGDGGGTGVPTWYVDPVDGTTNFAHGLPGASFSLGYVDADGPAVAVVADLARGVVVSATRGGGTTRDGEPVHCLDIADVAGEVVLTEWLGHRPWPGMYEMLAALAAASCTTRVLGSSALDLATVATGSAAAAVLGGYNTWDVVAGVLLARESGAVVMSRDGVADGLPEGGLLVASPGVADLVWSAWTGA
ncbi:MAG TPA: inositol monophosphatase [Streptosporangiales bacterium]